MSNTFSIFNRLVGDNHPVLIIADIGLNHNGSIDVAKKLIDEAVAAGCDIVKFQKRHVESLSTKEFLDAPDNRFPEFGATYREVREYVELDEKELKELIDYSESMGIAFFCTPFDLVSLDILERLNVSAYKSASHNLTFIPLIEKIASLKKPTIVSTGMSTLEEVDRVVDIFKKNNCPVALLHCVSAYPTTHDLMNFRLINFYRERYNIPVGYSGHEAADEGYLPSLGAVFSGASIVERHITLDHNMVGFDHKLSVPASQLKNFVQDIRRAEKMRGDGQKKLLEVEMVKRNQQRVSLVSKVTIPLGTIITRDSLTFKGPGTGIAVYEIDEVVGRTSAVEIPADTLIKKEMLF